MSSVKVAAILSRPQCVKIFLSLRSPDGKTQVSRNKTVHSVLFDSWWVYVEMAMMAVHMSMIHCTWHRNISGLEPSSLVRLGSLLIRILTWWRHQMQTFTALLALCVGIPRVTGGFPSQRPVTRTFDVFLDLCLNKRLCKRSRHRFETPSCSLWRHSNDIDTEFFQHRSHNANNNENFLKMTTFPFQWKKNVGTANLENNYWIS